ncbi:schwannomin-interacting protein 1-like isoform X2 [Pleurodeles waltl]|uniref:schwannomin-interacting protein 1-like isoform X2 n=1 Tax=Pleurodeles waltl TaxID=8319 RepID=UPI00370972C6
MAMDRIDPPSLDWKAFESHLAQLQQREVKTEAELVKQYSPGYSMGPWNRDPPDEVGEDHEMTKRITALTSGIHTHQSMQLCFINDSSSDLESDGEDGPTPTCRGHERDSSKPDKQVSTSPGLSEISRSSLLSPLKESSSIASSVRWKTEINQFGWKADGPPEKVRCFQGSEAIKCWLETEDLKRMSLDQLQRLSEGISHDIQRLNLELLQELTERDDLQMSRDALIFHLQELTQREDLDVDCTSTLYHLQEATRSAGHSDKESESRGGHTRSMQPTQSKGC